MKVIIDRASCVSCRTCSDACPLFFEENQKDTFSQIVEKFRLDGNIAEGVPPADMEDCAREAANLCPVQIITIEE
jgi:ferredoxin